MYARCETKMPCIRILTTPTGSFEQHSSIVDALQRYGCEYLKGRDEYTLLKEVVSNDLTELTNFRQLNTAENSVNSRLKAVVSFYPYAVQI